MRRAREAPQGARHDEAHRRAAAQRVEAPSRSSAASRRRYSAAKGRARPCGVDGRADPAIALDGHVEVEAAQAVGHRADERVHRVVLVERREERREARAHLGAERRAVAPLAAARELGRAAEDRPVLGGRGAVVVVEARARSMAVMRAGLSGVALSPSGRLCDRRQAVEARVDERARPCAPSPSRGAARGTRPSRRGARGRGVSRASKRRGGSTVANASVVVAARRRAARGRLPVLGAQKLAKRVHRVGVVVLIVLPVAEVERALVVDLHEDDGPVGPAQARRAARRRRGTSARSPRGTRRSRSSAPGTRRARWAASPGGRPACAPGTRGSHTMRSGSPKNVSSALMCGPGRSTQRRPSSCASSRKRRRRRGAGCRSPKSYSPGAVSCTPQGTYVSTRRRPMARIASRPARHSPAGAASSASRRPRAAAPRRRRGRGRAGAAARAPRGRESARRGRRADEGCVDAVHALRSVTASTRASSAASARMSSSSLSRARLARALAMVGSTNLRNERLLLHAVDEDEAPRVLELALHGDAIELAPERGALVGAEAARRARSRRGAPRRRGGRRSGSCRSAGRRDRRRGGRGARPGSRSSRARLARARTMRLRDW